MTAWDVLDKVIQSFPPVVMALILVAILAAVVIFIVGFSRHGFNFLKYGFKQVILDSVFENRFDQFEERFDKLEAKLDSRITTLEAKFDTRFEELDLRIAAIEVNHFGHLKNYLGILNGVLLDKSIIDNETKARLDNELRGM
jgi:hypothetical protein